MKRLFIFCLAAAMLCSCDGGGRGTAPRRQFVQEVRLATTPVKNQGKSSLCWIYAALATIETDHLEQGDSVNLSTDFVARNWLTELSRRYYVSRGKEKISMRGMMTMAIRLLRGCGAMPYDSYHAPEGVNWHALARRVMLADRHQHSIAAADAATASAADNALGHLPPHIFMLGAEYSPVDFAQSVCRHDEWKAYTSFTHHPFGKDFRLEVPDNRMDDTFANVDIDTLIAMMKKSLRRGHPVCWEGDISEPGFSWHEGIADVAKGQDCTQASRQRGFERLQTTDDHCMAIVGIARDNDGRRFFIAKNSWGTDNPYGGFMYLSEDYVRLKTIAVLLHQS